MGKMETVITLNSNVINRVNPCFVSFAIDTAQIVGGKWWAPNFRFNIKPATKSVAPLNLSNKKLIELSRQLAPAYLRIGGSDADSVYYQINSKKERRQERNIYSRRIALMKSLDLPKHVT